MGAWKPIHTEAVLLVGAMVAFSWDALEIHPHLDDSYISYRYARNLVEGAGLVWNHGEYVEGFTNLLWTLMVAGGLALGFAVERVGQTLGLISGLGMLFASHVFARSALPRGWRWMAGLAPWIVLSCASSAYCSTNGMETPLVVALVSAGLAAERNGRPWTMTLFAALLVLTRPDGGLLALVLFGYHLLRFPARRWRTWAPISAYAAVVLCLTIFRLAYYGSPVPNTFFAKVGGLPPSMGVRSVGAFLLDGALPLVLPAAVALWKDPRLRPAGAFVALTVLYVVAISAPGDSIFRFLLPALPPLAVLALSGAAAAHQEHSSAAPLLVACIPSALLGFVVGPLAAASVLAVGGFVCLARWSAGAGRTWLLRAASACGAVACAAYLMAGLPREVPNLSHGPSSTKRARVIQTKRDIDGYLVALKRARIPYFVERRDGIRLVAAAGIGYFGYYTRLPILDYLGLVDPVVARSRRRPEGEVLLGPGHHRTHADYVFSRRPDYILIGKRDSDPAAPLPAVRAIWDHPDLDAHYEYEKEAGGYRRVHAHRPRTTHH
jgi:hypothetical protein